MMFILYLVLISMIICEFIENGLMSGFGFMIFCTILYLIIVNILFKRINNFLVLVRFKKELCQSISFKIFVKNIFRNNFDSKTGEPKIFYVKEMLKESDKIERFFQKNKNKKFCVVTHSIMFKKLEKYQSKGLITINPVDNSAVKKKKEIEIIIGKLDYIGFGSIINLKEESYRKYMTEPFELKKYEIN